ncbi:MAG: sigma-54 dependent transcriptional regulator [Bacteroidetes bacterium]|nr:sigma-54 dependent transcriptional regulator [Bacteroidota bacterium]
MKNKIKIAVVDDEEIIRITLADDLRDHGFDVREFSNGKMALDSVEQDPADIIISDLKMPVMHGLDLLSIIKKIQPDTKFIIMTAFGTVDNAVEAMKKGAYDYIMKPFKIDELLLIIARISELTSLQKENHVLRSHLETRYDLNVYIGENKNNIELHQLIKLVAGKDTIVLVSGETGTGKEHIANIIHYNSLRKAEPFIKVSCAILARETFESELFGHTKGAFPGAEQDKMGRFELADGGTLLLDDVDDIPYDLQVKLLRVLQENEIERVGGSELIKVNFRLIVSTKKDLRRMVDEGKFREDLYYRLNIFPISLAPLRDRRKDIMALFQNYLTEFAEEREILIADDVSKLLLDYHWPGNLRELKNMAERMVILATGNTIELQHVPVEIRNNKGGDWSNAIGAKNLEETISHVELAYIKLALEKNKNNKTKAAQMLGIPLSTLRSKMEKYPAAFTKE